MSFFVLPHWHTLFFLFFESIRFCWYHCLCSTANDSNWAKNDFFYLTVDKDCSSLFLEMCLWIDFEDLPCNRIPYTLKWKTKHLDTHVLIDSKCVQHHTRTKKTHIQKPKMNCSLSVYLSQSHFFSRLLLFSLPFL